MKSRRLVLLCWLFCISTVVGESQPVRSRSAMVVSQSEIASRAGVNVMQEGGNAIDAAVATAFTLAVTHPAAGNIGGGGFIVFRSGDGTCVAYDFREMAPAAASESMWLRDGKYDRRRHHDSHLAVGVPGTVAGLHLAWKEQGKLPWGQLVAPAIGLAREGFVVSHGLARSLKSTLPRMKRYPASLRQFTRNGAPYEPGDRLIQADLAATLERIARRGPDGFYQGTTAKLIAADMAKNGGLITEKDLSSYVAKRREPIRGRYRDVEIISMAPPSSGGTALVQMLNILEGYDLAESGFGAAQTIHLYVEAMRRAYADRALHLGDPEANPRMPIERLISKDYAASLRRTIRSQLASKSSPTSFVWGRESSETTHLSVVDVERNAVSLTYTLEYSYGSAIVVPGAGFILNNEMGDFNPVAGLTDERGFIGTKPNLTAPGKRMLSSMTPTIVARNGKLLMVTGSPGGRTIINTVMQTVVNVVDFKMNAQQAVDAGRVHHQWLPDVVSFEKHRLSPDTVAILRGFGHQLQQRDRQGAAQVIVINQESDVIQGGSDRRVPDGGAVGY